MYARFQVEWWEHGTGSAKCAVNAAMTRGGASLRIPNPDEEEEHEGRPDRFKAAGNRLFSRGDWDGATRQYFLALDALPLAAGLLGNLSGCSVELDSNAQGVRRAYSTLHFIYIHIYI